MRHERHYSVPAAQQSASSRTFLFMVAYTIAFLVGFLSTGLSEAQQLKVATGGAKNTYSGMMKEVIANCGDSVALIEQNTSGSMENVNLLVGNQINAAFVQTDVLYFRAKTEELGNVKTLLALHPEEVHFLAPITSGLKAGGTMGLGAKPVEFAWVTDLNGYTVGAAGGSSITAQVIRLQAEITYKVVDFENNDAVMAALKAGTIQAGVFVGGAPLGVVSGLKEGYKLLAFPEATIGKLKAVYRPAKLNYQNIRQMGVATVATDALFVTREYKTAKMTDGLAKLRTCVLGKLDELKETTGTHPKWQAVDGANHGKWPWYELPAPAAVATPTKGTK